MINRLAGFKDQIKSFIPKHPRTSMMVVYVYGIGLFSLVLLYIFGWCYRWYSSGIPDTGELIQFLKEYASVSLVAAVTFISVFNVDKNRDGRPDAAERQVKDEGNRRQ